jgi:cellulose biosynthesis protein BcsQ
MCLLAVRIPIAVIDWLRDFLVRVESTYDVVFIDANPSFSIYT